MMSKIFKKLIPGLLCILLGWILSNGYNTFKKEKTIPEVTTIEVRKARIRENIGLSTKVSEKEVVNILSSIEKGIVEAIYIKYGDYVEKGQKLIELRKDELVNNLKKEVLNLEQAREKLSLLTDIPNIGEVLEKDAEIQKSEWNLGQAERALEEAKSKDLPVFIPSYSISGEKKQREEKFGLSISLALYDKGIKKEEIKEAKINLSAARLELKNLLSSIKIDIAETMGDIDNRAMRLETSYYL